MRRAGGIRLGTLVFLAGCIVVIALVRVRFGGVAPTPDVFAARSSLDAALAESESSGRPVLALATADWCGPCQAFKRGALADDRVAALIASRTVPVLIDMTDAGDPEAQRAGRLLGVEGIPALVLVSGDEVAARLVGAVSAERVLEWLSAGAPETPPTPAG